MAKAYWIVRVSVRDEQRYPEYLAAAAPAFQKFGARFIVRGGAFETMEGSARERNVVVESRTGPRRSLATKVRNTRARERSGRNTPTLTSSLSKGLLTRRSCAAARQVEGARIPCITAKETPQ
jgi:uncharacterized protein (DUF1330 family)